MIISTGRLELNVTEGAQEYRTRQAGRKMVTWAQAGEVDIDHLLPLRALHPHQQRVSRDPCTVYQHIQSSPSTNCLCGMEAKKEEDRIKEE
jgi:hypothetical protein